jgi:hypothetical protein
VKDETIKVEVAQPDNANSRNELKPYVRSSKTAPSPIKIHNPILEGRDQTLFPLIFWLTRKTV